MRAVTGIDQRMRCLLKPVWVVGSSARASGDRVRLKAVLSWVFLGLLIHLSGVCETCAAPLQLLSKPVSSASQSSAGNADSVSPWLSADGRFVLFSSAANNLATNDNGAAGFDVFLRDRLSNTTVLISVAASGVGGGNGDSLAVSASGNGQFVLFQSEATDLVLGDTNGVSDVFASGQCFDKWWRGRWHVH
jgi:hypothetical protein